MPTRCAFVPRAHSTKHCRCVLATAGLTFHRMEDESGKNKALGVPGLMLQAGRNVVEDVKSLSQKAVSWKTLVDYRAVSAPTGMYDGLRRVRRNLNDLGYNYFLLLLGLIATCLVLRPSLLLPIAGIMAIWLYVLRVRASDVTIAGRTFGIHSQRIALVIFAIIILHFFTNVSRLLFSTLFWGVTGCILHATITTPNPGDDEQSDGGFVNYFVSSTSAAYTGMKQGVEAVGVPSQWFKAADATFSKLSGAV